MENIQNFVWWLLLLTGAFWIVGVILTVADEQSTTADYWSAIACLVATVSAILVLEGLRQNADSTTQSTRMECIKFQVELRKEWLAWQERVKHLKISEYPDRGAYTEEERALIREYWSKIALSEFRVYREFQDGFLQPLWEETKHHIYQALTSNGPLAEEWVVYYVEPEKREDIPIYEARYMDKLQQIWNAKRGKKLSSNEELLNKRAKYTIA